MDDLQNEAEITLSDFHITDIRKYFEFQKDTKACHMAAFTIKNPQDWKEFKAHWDKILEDEEILIKTIRIKDKVVGNIASFFLDGEREVSYWIDKNYWGKGIATKALKIFLEFIEKRPLYARAAYDNIGSLRVLEKCRFKVIGHGKYYSNARGTKIKEIIFELK